MAEPAYQTQSYASAPRTAPAPRNATGPLRDLLATLARGEIGDTRAVPRPVESRPVDFRQEDFRHEDFRQDDARHGEAEPADLRQMEPLRSELPPAGGRFAEPRRAPEPAQAGWEPRIVGSDTAGDPSEADDVAALMAENMMLKARLRMENERFGDLQRYLADELRALRNHVQSEIDKAEDLRSERDLWMARAEALAQPLFQKR